MKFAEESLIKVHLDVFTYTFFLRDMNLINAVVDVILENTLYSESVIEKTKKIVIDKIPIRTGKLADYIMNSLGMHVYTDFDNLKVAYFQFIIPPDRPYKIQHSKHAGEIGRGEDYTPINNEVEKRVHKIGNGKYRLEDSRAVDNYVDYILNTIWNIVVNTVLEVTFDMEIEVKI